MGSHLKSITTKKKKENTHRCGHPLKSTWDKQKGLIIIINTIKTAFTFSKHSSLFKKLAVFHRGFLCNHNLVDHEACFPETTQSSVSKT